MWDGLEGDFGVGVGAGGSFDVGVVSVEALYRHDFINVSGTPFTDAHLGGKTVGSLSASLGVPNTPVSWGGGITSEFFHPMTSTQCNCDGFAGHSTLCGAIEHSYSEGDSWSMGISIYLGGGFTASVSYDHTGAGAALYEIWN